MEFDENYDNKENKAKRHVKISKDSRKAGIRKKFW